MNRSLVLIALCFSACATAGPRPLKFVAPPGWVDLSTGAPAANLERLPPDVRKQLGAGSTLFMAMDLDHPVDGLVAVGRGVMIGPINFNDRNYVADLIKVMVSGGMTNPVVEPRLVQQVKCVRLRGDRQGPNGLVLRQLVFVFPAGSHVGQLTFAVTAARYAEYEPVFTRAAEGTTGLLLRKEPPSK